MKNFCAVPFYCCLFLVLLMLTASCRTFKNVTKEKETADSTIRRSEVMLEKKESTVTLEHKEVIRIKDTVRTEADSLRSSFSYDPKRKDTVKVNVKSGKLQGQLWLHPESGTGDLFIFAEAAKIPVDYYKEATTTATYHNKDSTLHQKTEDKQVATTRQTTNKEIRNNVVGGLLIFLTLFLLVIFLAWRLRRKAKEVAETIKLDA